MTIRSEPTGRVRAAARVLGATPRGVRDGVLHSFADLLERDASAIISANADDLGRGRDAGLSAALLDRLMIDESRMQGICAAVRDVAALDDPIGEVLEQRTLDNGLRLRKVRVPFGVVCVVYEARPNVTADAAAIAIKTGNGIVLRGSSAARATNEAIAARLHGALEEHDLPAAAVRVFDPRDRDGFRELVATDGSVDVVIPRGGEGLKRFLYEHARVPILAAAGGNCHVFVDASADREMARDIVINAKTQRPGVCNAAETLLVHRDREHDLLPFLTSELERAGVEVLKGEDALATEFLDLRIAVKVVGSVQEAVDHINRYGTQHSEAIVTADEASARAFTDGVDAACVYVNASTRFTDGAVFGLGAEVGISTSKLHARGPLGLRELTTTKYVLEGDGQVRS